MAGAAASIAVTSNRTRDASREDDTGVPATVACAARRPTARRAARSAECRRFARDEDLHMSHKKRKTAMAVFIEGKWLIGLPGEARETARIRLPLPERAPRRPRTKGRDER